MQSPALRPVALGPLDVIVEQGSGGAIYARSPFALGPYGPRVTDWLDHWAKEAPGRTFLAERNARGAWQSITYGEMRMLVRALGQALLHRDLSPQRPIAILADNSIKHAALALAALYVGIPYAPISPAYAQATPDFRRLREVIALLTPGLIYVEDGHGTTAAIATVVPDAVEILMSEKPLRGREIIDFSVLCATRETPALDAAHDAVGPDTIAKFMFTSGSTATPKAVITTNRMLCANQAMIAHALRFLSDEPPILLDWLPWNHSFGGNQNFNLALCHGGTLTIDSGRPTTEGIAMTLANLREIAPTLYFNVPRGFEILLPHLARDQKLASNFFRRLKLNFFAGAPMPRRYLEALDEIAISVCGERIVSMGGYGATESGPAALFWTEDVCADGGVGVPLPGCAIKLLPHGEKYDVRVKGPHATPGYWRQPEPTQRAFDDEGYYRFGDALRFADLRQPRKGFVFDGRTEEDFKLASGVWVNAGALRERFIAAFAPYVKDIAIAGPGEAYLAALVFPDIDSCRTLAPSRAGASPDNILAQGTVRAKFRALLEAHLSVARGSSQRVERIVLVAESISSEAGELTDKGTLNQAAVLTNRAELVRALYEGDDRPLIITTTAPHKAHAPAV